jgi:hypothetical protein
MTSLVFFRGAGVALLLAVICPGGRAQSSPVNAAAYPSLQAAIDANPGRQIQLPVSEYVINTALKITQEGTELFGPARIVQSNPRAPMVRIEQAKAVRLVGLTFTRSPGSQDTDQNGIEILNSRDVEIAQVRVSDNHTRASIYARNSSDVTVQGCVIVNYKGITVDDRTSSPHYGYAFKAIDGTGVQFRDVEGVVIRDNRIQEFKFLPTKAIRDKYSLGTLTVVPEVPGRLTDPDIMANKYTNNWHQGAGIQVTGPKVSKRVILSGNYIENAAQGMDVHADNVIVSGNIISRAMIGYKSMHGTKHVLLDGNQFNYIDLWGILLMPGAASHGSSNTGKDGKPEVENVDGGHIVSNNIFSNFGFGDQQWNWVGRKTTYPEQNVITILFGQVPENPPIRNILITGNQVYDSGRDTVLLDGKWEKAAPRYHYALYVEQVRQPAPVNVKVVGNLFDAGFEGVTNFPDTK